MNEEDIDIELEFDELINNADTASGIRRISKTSHSSKVDKSRKTLADKRSLGAIRKDNDYAKTCPVCSNAMTRRSKDGNCKQCGSKLYLHDGQYFTVSQPVERLLMYNWSEYYEKYSNLDVKGLTSEEIKKLMPSMDEISIQTLKNEVWAANKLIELCNRDINMCYAAISVYHETIGKSVPMLYWMVSNPLLKAWLLETKKRYNINRIAKAVERNTIDSITKKQNIFGKTFTSKEDL